MTTAYIFKFITCFILQWNKVVCIIHEKRQLCCISVELPPPDSSLGVVTQTNLKTDSDRKWRRALGLLMPNKFSIWGMYCNLLQERKKQGVCKKRSLLDAPVSYSACSYLETKKNIITLEKSLKFLLWLIAELQVRPLSIFATRPNRPDPPLIWQQGPPQCIRQTS